MENLGVGIPSFGIGNNIATTVVQIIVFLVIAFFVIKVIRIYFEIIDLKKDSEKNKEKIEEDFEKIDLIKKRFVKYGGILFAVVIVAFIILSNFM